ncbi:MAG: hypothetical protein ABIG11_11155 [bacterium]
MALPFKAFAATVGGQPGSFLRQEAGARSAAMAGAVTAISDDAWALFSNPALLAGLLKPEFSATQSLLLEDAANTAAVFSYPVWNGAVAAGYMRQAAGGFEQRATPFDSPVSFSVADSVFQAGFGFGIPAAFPLRAGLAVKSVRQSVAGAEDSSAGADAGLVAEPLPSFRLGLRLQNAVRPGITLVSREKKYPVGVDISPAYTGFSSGVFALTLAGRISTYGSGRASLAGGAEVRMLETAAARAGVQEKGFSCGLGLKRGNYQFDYSVLFHEVELLHNFTLAIRFGYTMQELEAEIKKGMRRFAQEDARRLAKVYALQADNYLKKQNYVEGIRLLEMSLLWEPDNRQNKAALAAAKEEMERNLKRQVSEQTRALALTYYERGEYDVSREYWNNILDIDRGDAQAHEYIAFIDAKLGSIEKKRLEEARKADEDRDVSRSLAAAARLLEQKKFAEAEKAAREAMKIRPEDSQARSIIFIAREGLKISLEMRMHQGLQLYSEKRFQEAMTFFESVLRDDPENSRASEKAGECRAVLEVEVSPENRRKVEQLYYMGVDAYLKGDYDKSRQYLGQITAIDPLNENARSLDEKLKKASKT